MTATTASARFDRMMSSLERRFFPDARPWITQRAAGSTLEIALGTGLNLSHYPSPVRLVGVDLNLEALGFARSRASGLGRPVEVIVADATALPFAAATFDTVVCTFALCEVPSVSAALVEFARVLRPDGHLLLADHVVSTHRLVRTGQRLLEALTIPMSGEHFTRRPSAELAQAGFEVIESLRRTHGAVEYVHARLSGANAAR